MAPNDTKARGLAHTDTDVYPNWECANQEEAEIVGTTVAMEAAA